MVVILLMTLDKPTIKYFEPSALIPAMTPLTAPIFKLLNVNNVFLTSFQQKTRSIVKTTTSEIIVAMATPIDLASGKTTKPKRNDKPIFNTHPVAIAMKYISSLFFGIRI